MAQLSFACLHGLRKISKWPVSISPRVRARRDESDPPWAARATGHGVWRQALQNAAPRAAQRTTAPADGPSRRLVPAG